MNLAHAEYRTDPVKFVKFLGDVRFQYPSITKLPMYRHLVLTTALQAKLMQDEDRALNLQRMGSQRSAAAQRHARHSLVPLQHKM